MGETKNNSERGREEERAKGREEVGFRQAEEIKRIRELPNARRTAMPYIWI